MSWDDLTSILTEARDELELEADRIPVDCPNDGTPLDIGPDGTLFCRWDGWTPD